MFGFLKRNKTNKSDAKTLYGSKMNVEHKIKNIIKDDEQVAYFLSTLGCFEEQPITVVSVLSDTYVISVKDARYSIDADLAKTIVIY
jgi:ferrous iron transport protein A